MKKLLVAISIFMCSATSNARDFASLDEVQDLLDLLFQKIDSRIIDRSMLNYVFYDSDTCQSCSDTEKDYWKNFFRQRMGSNFDRLNQLYSEHYQEVQYQYPFTGDAYLSNGPFSRSAHHILSNNIFTGCDDVAKGFIKLALNQGYSPASLRFVFLMADSGFESACEDNFGNPARMWRDGGHHIVDIKVGGRWHLVNTTSRDLDYIEHQGQIARLSSIEFASLASMPFGLLYAASFDVEHFLSPYSFNLVKNIYVSGTANSNICVR